MGAVDLTEGRAHDTAMTKGPWEVLEPRSRNATLCIGTSEVSGDLHGKDAAGIAWMRNHLTALLDAAEERDRLRTFVQRMADRITHPDGLPYCRDCGEIAPDTACDHLLARRLLEPSHG